MSTALDRVMAEAETASREIAPLAVPGIGGAAGLVPATAANTNLAKPSMDDFIDGGGMDVDEYVRVKPEGFRIGDKMQGLVDELTVEIDLSEITPIYSFRCELGGQTKFVKSYDGVTTSDSKNFDSEVARLTRVGEKPSGIYKSFEIPFELIEDLADTKKGSAVGFDAGTKVGYTPSVTGTKPIQSFLKRIRNSNPGLLQQTVNVKITHEKRTKGSYEWGVLNFELAE